MILGGKTHHFRKPLYLTTVGPLVPVTPSLSAARQDRLDPACLGESGVFVASFGHQAEIGDWRLVVEFGAICDGIWGCQLQLWSCIFKGLKLKSAGAFLLCFASCSRTFRGSGISFMYIVSWMALAFCHLNHCLESAVFFCASSSIWRWRDLGPCCAQSFKLSWLVFLSPWRGGGKVEATSTCYLQNCFFSFGCFVSSVLQLGKEATNFSPLFFFQNKRYLQKLQAGIPTNLHP